MRSTGRPHPWRVVFIASSLAARTTPLMPCPRRRRMPFLVTPAPCRQRDRLLIRERTQREVTEPHGSP